MTFEDEMESALENFMLEAGDLLAEMETGLLALEQDSGDQESINSVFRAAHTVKGSAGLFGLDPVVRFTHVVESVLDRMRSQQVPASAALIGVLLPCKDHIGDLVAGVAAGVSEETAEQAVTGSALLARLDPYLNAPRAAAADTADPETVPAAPAPSPETGQLFHLSLRFGAESLRNGMDPLSFIRYLSTLGEVVALTTLTDLLPETEDLDAEQCYLAFQVTLRTQESAENVEGVFDFVRQDSDIRVLPHSATPAEYAELVTSFGQQGQTVAGILVGEGAIPAAELRTAISELPLVPGSAPVELGALEPATLGSGRADADGTNPAGPVADEPTAVPQPRSGEADTVLELERASAGPAPASGPTPQRRAGDRGSTENQTIRVDAGRLDRLIDAVGELVIAGAGAELRASLSRDEGLQTALGEVMRLVEEVRDGALQLRMVPIGTTFSRFQRIVRDVSATLGKDVTLTVSGGDTEVDKALVEQIGDPLTHLVRNALDHGIESAEIRAARGKPARGTLRLNAFHDSGSIVIEVQDDGNGIDPDRVLAKAIERGLVEPNAVLTEKDIYGLIFEPGFSTAASVSNLSGRGVGMDVVKRNVTALRGTIDVESSPGQGTTLRIRLPLTLAIIDGFLVGVGGATFVIPLDRVVECVELPADSRHRDYMGLRGEVLSFIRLRSLFAIQGERPRRENVVVVEYAGTKTGLVVDALKGEFQTVIKPLGALFENVQGIGGSTILGNGDVALIVDVPTLVRHAEDWQRARLAHV
jgi:two-component system chemotaxis sensor kinase CheA